MQQSARRLFPRDAGVSYILNPGKSHVLGPKMPSIIESSLGRYFEKVCIDHATNPALIVCDGNDVLVENTYGTLGCKVEEFTRGLNRLGIRKGDRIGVWMPNNEEWVIAQFATAKLGAILVSLNPAYKKRELIHAMKLTEMKSMITMPSLGSSDYLGILQELFPTLATLKCPRTPLNNAVFPSMKHVIVVSKDPGRFLAFHDLLEKDGSSPVVDIDPSDPINIQFTSGTTGVAKGCLLSSLSILNNGNYIGECLELTNKDRVNICVPLFHCFGMVLGNLACVTHGSTMVYPSQIFNPVKTLQVVESQKCTALYGVPTMFAAELHDPRFDSFDLSSLRTGIMAGTNCPVELMNQVVRKMNLSEMTIAYGMTETAPVSFMCRTTDSVQQRCETVGRIMPNTECKIVNEENETVDIGQPGELHTRGYLVMNGYFNDEAATNDSKTHDGWMKTGDLTTMDDQGYLKVVGRIKDVIIRGGENIYPRELEELIAEIPGVIGAQVVGIPDQKYGEKVCAIIVCKHPMDESEIISYCKSHVSHQKVPSYVLFLPKFDEFLTLSGKVQKFKIRDWALSRLKK